MVFCALQRGDECAENGLLGEARNILHGDQFWPSAKHESLEFGEQIPPAIGLSRLPLAVEGEGLARGAAGKQCIV